MLKLVPTASHPSHSFICWLLGQQLRMVWVASVTWREGTWAVGDIESLLERASTNSQVLCNSAQLHSVFRLLIAVTKSQNCLACSCSQGSVQFWLPKSKTILTWSVLSQQKVFGARVSRFGFGPLNQAVLYRFVTGRCFAYASIVWAFSMATVSKVGSWAAELASREARWTNFDGSVLPCSPNWLEST